MPPDPSQRQRFKDSRCRAARVPDFYGRFYRRLMDTSAEIAAYFSGRDMKRIERKLRMTLDMVCDNADGQPGLGMYLELLGRTHGAMHISLPFLLIWREALIGTAAECDPEFDGDTRAAWEAVLDDLIAKMNLDA